MATINYKTTSRYISIFAPVVSPTVLRPLSCRCRFRHPGVPPPSATGGARTSENARRNHRRVAGWGRAHVRHWRRELTKCRLPDHVLCTRTLCWRHQVTTGRFIFVCRIFLSRVTVLAIHSYCVSTSYIPTQHKEMWRQY